MSLSIRLANPGDAVRVAEMSAEFGQVLRAVGNKVAAPLSADAIVYEAFGAKRTFSVLVAELDGALVGYSLLHPAYDPDLGGRILTVVDLFVRQAFRRSGVGKALMDAAAEQCRDNGARALVWWVRRANQDALRFYAKLGARSTPGVRRMHLVVAPRQEPRLLPEQLAQFTPVRMGHFLLESGHHARVWLDLEMSCLRPDRMRSSAAKLAAFLAPFAVDAICGPLVEGAFVALMVASELGVEFTYTERVATARTGLYPFDYRLPAVLQKLVRGKRIAIVNDVINAGSAVRGTLDALKSCGAEVVAIAALAVLGPFAKRLAADNGIALHALLDTEFEIWTPAECPRCADGTPLTDLLNPTPATAAPQPS